jgi:multicomponent Na+:H+ antiporter subunit D
MNTITIAWIALPFFLGFTIYLLPNLTNTSPCGRHLFRLDMRCSYLSTQSPLTLQLLDNFGVTLIVDQLSGLLYIDQCASNSRSHPLLLAHR